MIRNYQYRPELYQQRRHRLLKQLPPRSLALVVAHDPMPKSADQFFPYQFNTNLFYLTGLEHEGVVLLLWKGDDRTEEVLFIPPYDEHKAVWEGNVLTAEEAVARVGEVRIETLDRFARTFHPLTAGADYLYIEYNQHPRYASEVPTRALRWARRLRNDYPALPTRALYPLLARMRMIKDASEIEWIRQAIAIAEHAFRALMDELPHLRYEYEVEAFLHYNVVKAGADGIAFDTIAAAGRNATILHYTANNAPLKAGDLLLVDFGATVHGYHSDITRVLPIGGSFTPRQRKVYEAVWHVQRELKAAIRPGVTLHELNQTAGRLVTEQLLELGLLTSGEVNKNPASYRRYFMHGFGHHLGLDVHDAADASTPLVPGMVITCEPGIYIPEEGIGIRLENDILITENGFEDLAAALPIAPDEIERGE